MGKTPKTISLDEIDSVLQERFQGAASITCYVGSNSATPTASLKALTRAIENGSAGARFVRMFHMLLQGPVPHVKPGLQNRVMAYSAFSAGDVRDAVNAGRAHYVPVTLFNLPRLVERGGRYAPDLVMMKVARHPGTGELSLGLSVEALHAAISSASLVIAELDRTMPFTEGQSVVDMAAIDYLVDDERVEPCYEFPAINWSDLPAAEKTIGNLVAERFIKNGATIQVGIGKMAEEVLGAIQGGPFKDLGVHTELYSDGLMRLQQSGIVNNSKKALNRGYSITTLVMGSRNLYDFVNMRSGVQMRSSDFTNSAATIAQNAPFVSINTAIGVDLLGNVWADFIDPRHHYSGVGGQPDFVRALGDPSVGVAIIAMRSVTARGESKIVRAHPSGIGLTATSYDGVVVVTEYGVADLRGLSVAERGVAIASIAHPDHRDGLLRALKENPMLVYP